MTTPYVLGEMSMTPTELFAKNHGLTVAQVKRLKLLIQRCSRECVNAVSGNAHPDVPRKLDKLNHLKNVQAHADAWEADCDRTKERIAKLAKELGFTDVRYDSHVGTVWKGEDEFHVPAD